MSKSYSKKLFGTATVGSKGQVVIPSEARQELGIKTGDKLYVVGSPERKFVGFISEEQFQELVEHLTDTVEKLKNI